MDQSTETEVRNFELYSALQASPHSNQGQIDRAYKRQIEFLQAKLENYEITKVNLIARADKRDPIDRVELIAELAQARLEIQNFHTAVEQANHTLSNPVRRAIYDCTGEYDKIFPHECKHRIFQPQEQHDIPNLREIQEQIMAGKIRHVFYSGPEGTSMGFESFLSQSPFLDLSFMEKILSERMKRGFKDFFN
ncbi:MAG: hypothetical protein ABIH72_03660 [archaeon]